MRYLLSFLLGVCIGSFFLADMALNKNPTLPPILRRLDLQYAGFVLTQNADKKYIDILLDSKTPHGEPSIQNRVRFMYSASTKWYSINSFSHENIRTKELTILSKEQALPFGTRVIFVRDSTNPTFTASALFFILRSTY